MTGLTCFKTYDIRGQLGIDLDEDIAYRIGRAFAQTLDVSKVVLGRDVRASSEALAVSVARGLIDAGCQVLDLGLSGTEEMYFATTYFEADGGICVTASHNPMDYNGMKMVRAGSAPLDAASGLEKIKALAEENAFGPARKGATAVNVAHDARRAYVNRVTSFVDITALKPLKILVNAGHGTAGPTFDAIADHLVAAGAPLTFEKIFHAPDGTFPQGIPNPLLLENGMVISIGVSSLTTPALLLTANMLLGCLPKSF
jgi:phosphomannomutase